MRADLTKIEAEAADQGWTVTPDPDSDGYYVSDNDDGWAVGVIVMRRISRDDEQWGAILAAKGGSPIMRDSLFAAWRDLVADAARLERVSAAPAEGREFFSDYAAAMLSRTEEGVLRGLASLGNSTARDLRDFAAGFCDVAEVHPDAIRDALFTLDALGWSAPAGGVNPVDAEEWYATNQGRIALESAGADRG